MKNRKNPGSDFPTKNEKLEKKRSMFFQVGMVLTLALVLAAFEWTTVRTYTITDWRSGENIDVEELAPVTTQELPKPKPKPVFQTSIIQVVDDKTDIETEDIIFEDPEDGLNNLDYFIDDEKDEEDEEPVIFYSSETQPAFPGGTSALYTFLNDNIQYPRAARESNIQGTVYVKFVVWNDGSIRDATVLRGIGFGCDEEALRVVKMMPKWSPGLQRTMPVNVQMVLPVKFVLK